MAEPPDPNSAWPEILHALAAKNMDLARELLWPPGAAQDWFYDLAPMMESAGGRYEDSDRALAIFCYEQAQGLYQAQSSGATSGGDGMAEMNEMRGSHLGRKIWLLKS